MKQMASGYWNLTAPKRIGVGLGLLAGAYAVSSLVVPAMLIAGAFTAASGALQHSYNARSKSESEKSWYEKSIA